MNIFNLLKHKSQVEFFYEDETVREAAEKFSSHGYTAVPVISRSGAYVESVTEGDILRYIMAGMRSGNISGMDTEMIVSLPKKREVRSVHINASLDSLVEMCKIQNFVPVVDDRGIFIGIVTRKDLICYSQDKYTELRKELEKN